MTARPILMSAPMVRALLAGTKTQTRRAMKLPMEDKFRGLDVILGRLHAMFEHGDLACPYGGMRGDTLWVREAFRLCAEADPIPPRDTDAAFRVWYEADAPHQPGAGKLRPGMFMPRWASRITLEVAGVRVERLQDISEADAIAEGVSRFPGCRQDDDAVAFNRIGPVDNDSFPIARYAVLWEQINGPGSWDANPWVWVVSFKRKEG